MEQGEISSIENPGEALKSAREARGLTIADIARETRQSQDTLSALERMETDSMSATILRMQARSYALCLGLDGEQIASSFAARRGQMQTPTLGRSAANRFAELRDPIPLMVSAFGLMLIAIIGGYWVFGQSASDESVDRLAISSRIQLGIEEVPPHLNIIGNPSRLELKIVANRLAWLEVRGSDGTIFRSRYMARGEHYFPRAEADWTLTARDAGAFSIYLDEEFVFNLGDDAQAVYSRNVDELSLAATETLERALAERDSSLSNNR